MRPGTRHGLLTMRPRARSTTRWTICWLTSACRSEVRPHRRFPDRPTAVACGAPQAVRAGGAYTPAASTRCGCAHRLHALAEGLAHPPDWRELLHDLELRRTRWPGTVPACRSKRRHRRRLAPRRESLDLRPVNLTLLLCLLRKALTQYSFNTKMRDHAPEDIAAALAWVSRSTVNVSVLANAANARAFLEAAVTNVDGKRAAASTARRHRVIVANALDYAKELGAIDFSTNPVRAVKWTAPKTVRMVDRRCVVNQHQARKLLNAIRVQQPSGPRLVAYFACIYYAALRPEEVDALGEDNLTLLPHTWNTETGEWEDPPGSDGFGEFEFGKASPLAGRDWTDDGDQRDHRQLKHRAKGETRTVPVHPELAKILRATSPSSAPGRTAGCSSACGAGSSPRSPPAGPGSSHGSPCSPRQSRSHRSPRGSTTSGTPACRCGSTPASYPPRPPTEPGTAPRCSCGSTPSASTARTPSPRAA